MTPATERRAKSDWYTRPAEAARNAAVPHATRQYYTLATRTERAVLEFLMANGTQADDLSWKCKPPGKLEIAKQLEYGVSTVQRAFRALERKHFIRTSLEYYRAGRKVKGKTVIIFAFADALARRRADDAIAKTVDRRVIFRGRGRRPMTPAEAVAWDIALDRVPEFEEPGLFDEPAAEQEPEQAAQPQAPAEVRELPAPPAEPAEDPILSALIDCVTAGAPGAKDAADCYRAVNDPSIPRETVAGWIRDATEARRRVNPREVHSAGFFLKRLPDYLAKYRQIEYRSNVARQKAEREREELDRELKQEGDEVYKRIVGG